MWHREEAGAFYGRWRARCGWGWKPAGTRRGSSGCWGVGTRVVDGRRGEDSHAGHAEAEDGPARRGASFAVAEGREFSADLGAQLEERDARQLLLHRHKLVQARTRVKNQLQALALNQGLQKKKLWTASGAGELEELDLLPWASRRRRNCCGAGPVERVDRGSWTGKWKRRASDGGGAVDDASGRGAGDRTGFRADVGAGDASRGRQQVASYFGLIPSEHSSGGRQRLGHISKQGSSFLRGLLVEAAQRAVRDDAEYERDYPTGGAQNAPWPKWPWPGSWR